MNRFSNKTTKFKKESDQFSIENCKILNAKIYFKPDKKVNDVIIRDNTFKIKELYEDENYHDKLVFLMTYRLSASIKSKILQLLQNEYKKSDFDIFMHIYDLIHHDDIIIKDNSFNLSDVAITDCLDIHHNNITHIKNCTNLAHFNIHDFIKNVELPYKSNSFNLIVLIKTLHHIQNDNIDSILLEIKRIIKPHGILIIKEYNINPLIQLETHLLDTFHELEEIVLSNKILAVPLRNSAKKEVINYNTESFWNSKIIDCGFIESKKELYDNPFNSYISTYISL